MYRPLSPFLWHFASSWRKELQSSPNYGFHCLSSFLQTSDFNAVDTASAEPRMDTPRLLLLWAQELPPGLRDPLHVVNLENDGQSEAPEFRSAHVADLE